MSGFSGPGSWGLCCYGFDTVGDDVVCAFVVVFLFFFMLNSAYLVVWGLVCSVMCFWDSYTPGACAVLCCAVLCCAGAGAGAGAGLGLVGVVCRAEGWGGRLCVGFGGWRMGAEIRVRVLLFR